MKKIFLVLSLTALMHIVVNAEENNINRGLNDQKWAYKINGKEYKTDITTFDNPAKGYTNQSLKQTTFIAPQKNHNIEDVKDAEDDNKKIKNQNVKVSSEITTKPTISTTNLADSFMAAFGMEVDAGGNTGEAAPGMGGSSSGGTMAVGMSTVSTTSINQVTPPFTPYSYQK